MVSFWHTRTHTHPHTHTFIYINKFFDDIYFFTLEKYRTLMIGPLWLCFSQEVLHRPLIKPETCFLYINTSAEQDWEKKKKKQDECAKVSSPKVKVTIRKGQSNHTRDHHTLWFMQSSRKSCSAPEHRPDKRVHRLTEILTDAVTEEGRNNRKKGSFLSKTNIVSGWVCRELRSPLHISPPLRSPSSWLGEYQMVNAGVMHSESTLSQHTSVTEECSVEETA